MKKSIDFEEMAFLLMTTPKEFSEYFRDNGVQWRKSKMMPDLKKAIIDCYDSDELTVMLQKIFKK